MVAERSYYTSSAPRLQEEKQAAAVCFLAIRAALYYNGENDTKEPSP